jgi:uncharacterized membrane protein
MHATTNRWLRIARHLWLDEGDARRALGADGATRLQARIAQSEQTHSGEIRICVEAGLPFSYLWRRATARERAVAMFGKLRVWDTERNNGVLIYLLLAEHRIEIVADRGLNTRIESAQWDLVMSGLVAAFQSGQIEAGLLQAVDTVGAWLTQHFPLIAGEIDRNELPDFVFIR